MKIKQIVLGATAAMFLLGVNVAAVAKSTTIASSDGDASITTNYPGDDLFEDQDPLCHGD
jgi:hypothetical protein